MVSDCNRVPYESLVFCGSDKNDLYRVACDNGLAVARFDSAADGVRSAPDGAAVLVLADGYPTQPTQIDAAVFDEATARKLRLYVEYPAALPGLAVGPVRQNWRARCVVTSDAFGESLRPMRILMAHDCHLVEVEAADAHIVAAPVAGLDTAVYGLTDTEPYPVLFELPGRRLLVATTKLSQFVTARYAPCDAWRSVWRMVFAWLRPNAEPVDLEWTPAVRPTYSQGDIVPEDAPPKAVVRGIDWHTNARLLVGASWRDRVERSTGNDPVGPAPEPDLAPGDGEFGLLEGLSSNILWDGSQCARWWLRTDCNGESALAFALRAEIDGDERSRRIAANLIDWVYFRSGLLHDDPDKSNYGLLGWAPDGTFRETFYGDNDIKAILGCMGAAALLGTDRWDVPLLKNILGNFRTTGKLGFRRDSFWNNVPDDWTVLADEELVNPHPHFQAWIWSSYLWLHHKTGYAPLLERTLNAIRMTMEAYPGRWRWTNGMQQERARMLLPLAWLVRVDDRPEHRSWLRRILEDMRAAQHRSGAFLEEIGDPELGDMPPPLSNTKMKCGEASLIMKNGDPIADLLYTNNFALIGLHEAAAATGDPLCREMEDRLADFLVRVQARNEGHAALDGAWLRAFDVERWEYWAANSDLHWGPWCVECGWTQGWVSTGLALRELGRNLWDLTAGTGIARHFETVRRQFFGEER